MIEVHDMACSPIPIQIDLHDFGTQTDNSYEPEQPKVCLESSSQTRIVNQCTTATQMSPPVKQTIIEQDLTPQIEV